MTTVSEIVEQALRDANVIGQGETADGNTGSEALATLNQMLALWSVENVNLYAQQETSFTPDGATSYTVGDGADVDMARPDRVDALFWRSGGIDYPVILLDTFEQWEAIPQKAQAGEPQYAFYRPSYPEGTLYLYPQPASGTVYLVTQTPLPADVALADTLTLPPEYVMPVRLNLYLLLAGMYGSAIKPTLATLAASSFRTLRRNNLRIQPLKQPTEAARSNIFAG